MALLVSATAVVLTTGGANKRVEENAAELRERQRPARMAAERSEGADRSGRDRPLTDLDPEKALELLEKDRAEEKNVAVRAEKAAAILAQLCRNGFTREAWALIDPNEGLVREKSLEGFFRDANLPQEELVGLMDGLRTQERAMGLFGYWSRFSPDEFAVMDLSPFQLRSKNEQGVFRKTIENLLGEIHGPNADPAESAGLRKGLLTQLAKLMNEGSMDYWHLGDLVRKDPSKDGFTYWEISKSIRAEAKGSQPPYNGVESQILRTMTVQDAERVMTMAMVKDTPEAKAMHIAMEQWLLTDYDKAAGWYESHKDGFDVALRDRAAAAFMRASAKRRNFEEALGWYAALEGETWKKGMRGEMLAIRKQAGGDAPR